MLFGSHDDLSNIGGQRQPKDPTLNPRRHLIHGWLQALPDPSNCAYPRNSPCLRQPQHTKLWPRSGHQPGTRGKLTVPVPLGLPAGHPCITGTAAFTIAGGDGSSIDSQRQRQKTKDQPHRSFSFSSIIHATSFLPGSLGSLGSSHACEGPSSASKHRLVLHSISSPMSPTVRRAGAPPASDANNLLPPPRHLYPQSLVTVDGAALRKE